VLKIYLRPSEGVGLRAGSSLIFIAPFKKIHCSNAPTIKAMNIQIYLFLHLQSSSDTILYSKCIGAYTDGFAVLSSAGTSTVKPPG